MLLSPQSDVTKKKKKPEYVSADVTVNISRK